jgi:carbamate kinase
VKHELVLTFGDGPQIGHLLLESEADRSAPPSPLDVVGAKAVGMIGYLLEQALLQQDPSLRVATLVTQTLVAVDDPAFASAASSAGVAVWRRDREALNLFNVLEASL